MEKTKEGHMRISAKALMSLILALIAAWVVITALKWPLMSGLFVIIVGASVFFMAMVDFCMRLFGKETSEAYFKVPENVSRALAMRRTLSAFMFITGFFVLILLFGIPIAVPLFVFFYLKLHREGWKISLGLAGLAWISFYGLFIWLLKTPFLEGWVQRWLRSLGVG